MIEFLFKHLRVRWLMLYAIIGMDLENMKKSEILCLPQDLHHMSHPLSQLMNRAILVAKVTHLCARNSCQPVQFAYKHLVVPFFDAAVNYELFKDWVVHKALAGCC